MAKRHPPEIRAAAIAAVAAGEQPAAVARRYGISQGLLTGWWQQHVQSEAGSEVSRSPGAHARDLYRVELIDLVEEFVTESFTTLSAQARLARDESWLKTQSLGELAQYRGAELDRLIRILPAFRPPDDEPEALEGEIAG